MATGALYVFALLVSIAVALYAANSAYRITEPGVEPALTDFHRHALHVGGAAFAVVIAVWSAAYGVRRAWWKGFAAFAVGVFLTGIVFSALGLLDLPFSTGIVGLVWLRRDVVFFAPVWLGATVVFRLASYMIDRARRRTPGIA